jgi:hypothetical protein
MARQGIIPVRVSSADRAALKAAAGGRPVSTWLRDLGLAEARRLASTKTVAELLDSMASRGPHMSDEEAMELALEGQRWARAQMRRERERKRK